MTVLAFRSRPQSEFVVSYKPPHLRPHDVDFSDRWVLQVIPRASCFRVGHLGLEGVRGAEAMRRESKALGDEDLVHLAVAEEVQKNARLF